jgi:hypothetical protein
VIRVFKNARRHETAGIEKETAPSYFLECLLYNVPNATFRAPLSDAYRNCLTWLTAHRDRFDGFQCQNELVKLFGDGPDRWSTAAAGGLLQSLSDQWDIWQ